MSIRPPARLGGAIEALVISCLALCLSACNQQSAGRGRIHGQVTIDSIPLAEGQIRFLALDGGIGSDGQVTDGNYDIPSARGLSSGKYRVQVSAEKSTGKKVPDLDAGPGDMKDEIVESLPEKFNRKSTLEIDFDANQDQAHDFELKSKK